MRLSLIIPIVTATNCILKIIEIKKCYWAIGIFHLFLRVSTNERKICCHGSVPAVPQRCQDHVSMGRHHRRPFPHTAAGVVGIGTDTKKCTKFVSKKRIYFKRNKHILNKKGKTLTEEERVCLHEILKQSPQLQRVYALKEAFFTICSMKDPASVTLFLSRWLQFVEESGIEEYKSLLKTFTYWKEEIQERLTNVYSNGFTERRNNKINVLKRTAFGFRNFNRFRARILWVSRVKQK